jgi:hypothetical protein
VGGGQLWRSWGRSCDVVPAAGAAVAAAVGQKLWYRSGGGHSGVLRIVNPVFQRQISEAGEVAGIARDEGKAVGHRCAANQ